MSKEATFVRPRTPHYDSPTAVGERVEQSRKNAGLTQRELAFPGCTPAYISRMERGERVPSLQVLREIAAKLGVSEDWLAWGKAGLDPDVAEKLAAVRTADEDDLVDAYKALASAARRAAKSASE